MARIRTIKPELFQHSDLYDLEIETKLPLRLAWIALFTCCDREGRFKWRPRELKLQMLPYDDCDISRVLDAFVTRGFVVKYEVGNEYFGHIPSWKRHQFINNKETQSDIPEPPQNECFDSMVTRESRDDDANESRGVKEGKGKEENDASKIVRSVMSELSTADSDLRVILISVCTSELSKFRPPSELQAALIMSWREYSKFVTDGKIDPQYMVGINKFYSQGIWDDKIRWRFKDGRVPHPAVKTKSVKELMAEQRGETLAI